MADSVRLADLKRRLAEYKAAETAILMGQAYTIEEKSLKRADLATVQRKISELETEIAALEPVIGGRRGTMRSQRVLPRRW